MVKNLIKSLKNTPTSTGAGMTAPPQKKRFSVKRLLFSGYFTAFTMMVMFTTVPAYASEVEGSDEVREILTQMVNIVGMIFTAVGIILAVYSVGQLVLAFKNEDADSKSRASTLLIVSIILIAFPSIVEGLNLVDRL